MYTAESPERELINMRYHSELSPNQRGEFEYS